MACKYINNNGAPLKSQYVNFVLKINILNPYIYPISQMISPYPISQIF